jgi:hypothetical protein
MPLLVASLLGVVFSLRLREIDFFKIFYIYQNVLQFFLWVQNGVVFVVRGVSLATILWSIHVSNRVWKSHAVLWLLLSWTVCRKGYSSAYYMTYSLLSCFSPKVLRSVLYGSQHKWRKRAKYSPFIRPQKSVLSVLHPSLHYLVGLPVHKPECVWWMSGRCK